MDFKGFTINSDGVTVNLDMSRTNKNFQKAQFALDSAVMTSMVPFMPMEDNHFINETRKESASMAGTGVVCAAAKPFGHFLYEGKTMVDEKTGSPWATKDGKKVYVSQYTGKTNAREYLQYTKTKHPKAQSHWFDPAKKQDGDKWVRVVKTIAGGGK